MTYPIDKHIPLPPQDRGRRGKYPFGRMEIGDSIAVDEFTSAKSSAYAYGERHSLTFTCVQDKGQATGRIWRIA